VSELPTGTITFLFTDIERSTDLLISLGDRYSAALARHHALLREALGRYGGVEVTTEGDSFFVVFRDPLGAVRGALDGQRALHAEPWPDAAEVRVRVGVHTGQGVLGADGYVGLDVHRAARIASAGHGGQVLVSDATRALVEQGLPEGVRLRDLGRHRLKGLPAPERIFQLTAEDLPSDFPLIRSLDARQTNLPAALTSFIGRERQVTEITEGLSSSRLLTLTGPGGTGKTRLSVRAAEEVIGDYEHGCWFVALDALRDPQLVPSTVADVLGLKVPPDQSALAALESWLTDRQLLLILDNFEQVTEAREYVATLLEAAPGLRVMITSRVPLGLYGEHEYPVPPLASAPELRVAGATSAEALSQYEAVRLFIDRAVAVKPDFRVTNANAPAVAEVCARLDGLPLGIELAAARIKLVSPEEMVARLEQSLSLLASTASNLPARQRTLLGAIEWSYDLLTQSEQRLFRQLSVFRGGFTIAAAEAVVPLGELGTDVLEGVSSLLNNSLLRTQDQAAETRFGMLETIREYGRQRLTVAGEASELMNRHAAHFFGLAAQAEPQLMGGEQVAWLDRLQRDHDNLRAAFERAPELGMLDQALAAAGAIWRFWQLRGYFAEARTIFDGLLAQPAGAAEARAKGLTGAGGITYWQGDYDATGRHYAEASRLYEAIGERAGLAGALTNESYLPMLLGRPADARPRLERAVELYREVGDEIGATEAEWLIGFSSFLEGRPEEALRMATRVVDAHRATGARWHVADRLIGLANVQAALGQWQQAAASTREALAIFRELGNELGQSNLFETAGSFASWLGETDRAARLMGKSEQLKEQLGGGAPAPLFDAEAYREKARRELGQETFDRLLAEGARLTAQEAAALVETFDPPPDGPRLRRSPVGDADLAQAEDV